MEKYIARTSINFGTVIDKVLREKRYEAGDVVELNEKDAEPLLAIKAIEPHDPKSAFQDALRKTEDQARQLEAAGGDPGEAARELRDAERQALTEAIDASAVLVVADAMTIDDAAAQICGQVKSATLPEVAVRLQEKVDQLKGATTAVNVTTSPSATVSAGAKATKKRT